MPLDPNTGAWIPDYPASPYVAPTPAPAPLPNWTLPESWMAPAMPTPAPAGFGADPANPYAQTFGGGGGGGGLFPAGTEVYGGSGWMDQMAQQMYQMFMANMQQEMATGYVTPGGKPPTKSDALSAIYQGRSDLQEQHQRKYEDWSVTRYMEHWLDETGELREGREWTDELTGASYTNTKDLSPTEFAISHGMLQPFGDRENWGVRAEPPEGWRPPLKGDETEAEIAQLYEDYLPENAPWLRWPEKQRTLEREAFEAGERQWEQDFLRAQGLDEEAIRQFNEAMGLQREQYGQSVIEGNRQFLRAQGLDEEDMRRWETGQEQLAEATAEDKRRWNETFAREQGLDEEAIRQFGEQMTYSYYQADQAQAQFEAEQLRLIGVSEQQAAQFGQTHQLARDQFDVGNQQWQAAFGLEQARFDRETGQWERQQQFAESTWQAEHEQRVTEFEATYGLDREAAERLASQWEQQFERGGEQWGQQFGLAQRQQTEEERYNRLQQELEMMGLMTQQQGPGNWLQYEALQRRAGPGWREGLMSGAGFAPFEAGGPMPRPGQGMQQATREQLMAMTPEQQTQYWAAYNAAQPGGQAYTQAFTGTGPQYPAFTPGPRPHTPVGQQPMPIASEGVQFAPELEAGWQQNLMQQGMQYIQPHTISPQQWGNMMPSQQQMLMGQVQAPVEIGGWGGSFEDYLDRMMKAWPGGGQPQAVSQFTGW